VINTEKLDDTRRLRATVVIFEQATGRPASSQSLFSDDEQLLPARGGRRSRVPADAGGEVRPEVTTGQPGCFLACR
jgi:hypothetical protein